MPAAAFVWRVKNNSSQAKQISITFTFKNGTGSRKDSGRKCISETFRSLGAGDESEKVIGVALEQKIDDLECTYGIASLQKVAT